ncbi:hypothetical protein OG394_30585 [Kribbella sp. NBC_01245]|uniref:hypothetical protein n=1 Tax=Kribbella sp. NBC_01245 TaxID=2903578 RepID=UPI002E2DC770|nr:hypothetical protein [Kribbella sp. NBC_01245]
MPEGARIPNGGKNGELGADVSSDDGWYGYRDAPYKFEVVRTTNYEAYRERALTYSGAVSVYGFSVAATTIKAVSRSQRIDAGSQNLRHMVFGHSPISGAMKVFYSY